MKIRNVLENGVACAGLGLLPTGLFGGIVTSVVGAAVLVDIGIEHFEKKHKKEESTEDPEETEAESEAGEEDSGDSSETEER